MGDDFNSSDIELEEAQPKLNFRAGYKSIQSMVETRDEDRIATKNRLRQLQDTRGAPGSIYMRALWLNRFEGYTALNKVSIDDQRGPVAETLIRFIETMVGHIKVLARNKPAPQLKTMRRGLENLIEGLTFKYKDFKITGHDARRIDTVLDALAKENKLLRGKWKKSEWIGVLLVEKMVRAYFQASLDQGCKSWDVQLSKILSLVLVSACCCRAGEVSLSRDYTTEFMKWEHITLKLEGGATIDHLEATIEICYEKSKKWENNDNRSVTLRPLRTPELNVICPIKLLLIQALRAGNIKDASTVGEALVNASQRSDKAIQWLFPARPVIPAISRPNYAFLEMEKPAPRMQLYNSIIELGLIAGVLARLSPHQLRKGAARDLSHLKKSISGVADEKIARGLGQSRRSLGQGITDDYVGDIDDDLYTMRVEDGYEYKRAPAIGAPFKKRKLDAEEIKKYCNDHNLDSALESNRTNARRHLYADQQTAWMEAEKNRAEPVALAQRTSSQVNVAAGVMSHRPEDRNAKGVNSLPPALTTAREEDTALGAGDALFLSLIDPELLLGSREHRETLEQCDEENTLSVAPEAAERLMDVLRNENVMTGNTTQDEDCEMQGLGLIVENILLAEKSSALLLLPGNGFVDAFSKINIVYNTTLHCHLTTLDEVFPSKVPMGNSRDYPTIFKFKCPNHTRGCLYDHPIKGRVNDHLLVCDPEKKKPEAREDLRCHHCTDEVRIFATEKALSRHIIDYHDWVPTTCPQSDCSNPNTIFQHRKAYANHLNIHHKPIDPTLCTFPGCASKITWSTSHSYSQHLKAAHKLMSVKAQTPYLPRQPKKSYFPACSCPIGGSTTCDGTFKTARGLQGHLMSKVHKFTEDAAKEITNEIVAGSNG